MTATHWEYRILGPLEVLRDGSPIEVRSARQRALLALLMLRAGEVVATERIVDDLWGEDPPAAGVNAVQFHVSKLRALLRDERGRDPISTVAPGYRLDAADADIDARRFTSEAAEGSRLLAKDPDRAASLLGSALARWRGPALADLAYEEFAQVEIRRLAELRVAAATDLLDAEIRCGRHEAAIPQLEALIAAEPLRERPRGLLMLALYRAGRQADALRTYQEARRVLGEELGLEPGDDLKSLEEQILLQDPALAGPARPMGHELPGGTVTFLFTDIAGSTRLWETRPAEMAKAMAQHDDVVAAAIGHHHGFVVKHTGDGFMAVFRSASDALGAALEAQRALSDTRWPGGTRPAVRMGLHAGDATPRDGDYRGTTVNKAARIGEAAHADQVIMSETVAELARHSLPDGAALLELGTFRLRDLSQSETLWQLLHRDLDVEFPPPRTLDRFQHNLPAQASSFLGREDDLDKVDDLLHVSRLLTVYGPGGCGKTRLALQAAAAAVERHDDGVWLVRLEDVDRDGDVAAAVAATVGAVAGPDGDATAALLRWAGDKDTMLVLDNCEHVIAGTAALAMSLMERCPGATVLATSRRPLGVGGERSYRLAPLSVPRPGSSTEETGAAAAVQLFAERAQAVLPDFTLTETNLGTVGEICRALDGVPLAVELAAARTRHLDPQEIAARLHDRFGLLTGGSATARARHQTLQATVEWSYDLLAGSERTLFDRLSVFRGGFTLDAAEAVASGGEVDRADVLDLVGELVDSSMVVVAERGDGTTRYALLETMRQFAADRLARLDVAETTAKGHAAYFTALAEEAADHLRGPDEVAWGRRLDAELPNLRQAIAWSLAGSDPTPALRIVVALKLYFIARDELAPEARAWVRAALRASAGGPLEAPAYAVGGLLAWSAGDLDEAEQMQEHALAAARAGEDEMIVLRALNDLGLVVVDRGDTGRARLLFGEALDIAERVGDSADVAWCLSNMGMVAERSRQREFLERSRRLNEQSGRATGMAHLDLMLGWFDLAAGELPAATARFTASRERWTDLANQASVAMALCGLIDVAMLSGEIGEARTMIDEALHLSREIDWAPGVAKAETRAGALALATGDLEGAERSLAAAASRWEIVDMAPGLARVLGLRAIAAAARADHAPARDLLERSSELWVGSGRAAGSAWTSAIEGYLALRLEDHGAAVAALLRSLEGFASAADDPVTVDGLLSPETGGCADILDALEWAAAAAAAAGEFEAALRILGCVEARRTACGIVVSQHPGAAAILERAAAAAGEAGSRARAAGAAIPWDAALVAASDLLAGR